LPEQHEHQVGQHATGQQHQQRMQVEARWHAPGLERGQAQFPRAVRDRHRRADALLGQEGLRIAGTRSRPVDQQLVAVTALAEPVEARIAHQVAQFEQHRGEAPEQRVALAIDHVDRLATDHRDLAVVEGQRRAQHQAFLEHRLVGGRRRVAALDHPLTEHRLVAGGRVDVADDPVRRELDGTDGAHAAQQVGGVGLEILDTTAVVADIGLHRFGRGQRTADLALEDRDVADQLGLRLLATLALPPLQLDLQQVAPSGQEQQQGETRQQDRAQQRRFSHSASLPGGHPARRGRPAPRASVVARARRALIS
jgi:hypothetical protein